MNFTFPAGATIAGNGYVVVCNSASAMKRVWPSLSCYGNWTGSLSKGGEILQLADK